LPSWEPVITLTDKINACKNLNKIYIMEDPDRSNSKVDLVFFAHDPKANNRTRVLIQATVSNCSITKVTSSFTAMSRLEPAMIENTHILDRRMFIGPNSGAIWIAPDDIDDSYQVFLKPSSLFKQMQFPINEMCDSNGTENTINLLVKKAESLGDTDLANRLVGDMNSLTLNKKRRLNENEKQIEFSLEMEEFFQKLEKKLRNPEKRERQIGLVRKVFDEQDIEWDQLIETGDLAITDDKLQSVGIDQLGLRIAVLSVLKSLTTSP
jgi:hypothetical protein